MNLQKWAFEKYRILKAQISITPLTQNSIVNVVWFALVKCALTIRESFCINSVVRSTERPFMAQQIPKRKQWLTNLVTNKAIDA